MSAESVARRIRELWGEDFAGPVGVLHVAAVGRDGMGRSQVFRIDSGAPSSATDGFALAVARARSDVILTTGRILRSEPGVSHFLEPDLLAWRREVLAKREPPTVVVLTRGRDLPYGHPVFDREHVLVATRRDAARSIEDAMGQRPVQVMQLTDSSPRTVVAALARRGFHDVCVEVGPSTAYALYESPPIVDELMLSIYAEKPLTESQSAGAFVDDERLREVFGDAATDVARDEASGPWRFRRYVRSS